MYRVTVPQYIRWVYGSKVVWQKDTAAREIFLTFDDGPIPGVTPRVLDMLEKYNAKATFFMVGENAARYPQLVEAVRRAGHGIGNHSYNHLKGWRTPDKSYYENIDEADKILKTNLFRPPHGQLRLRQARRLSEKYKIVMWTVLSGDYNENLSPQQCFENVKKHGRPGAVIVFHDSLKAEKNMFWALEETLKYFQKSGYRFGTLG